MKSARLMVHYMGYVNEGAASIDGRVSIYLLGSQYRNGNKLTARNSTVMEISWLADELYGISLINSKSGVYPKFNLGL